MYLHNKDTFEPLTLQMFVYMHKNSQDTTQMYGTLILHVQVSLVVGTTTDQFDVKYNHVINRPVKPEKLRRIEDWLWPMGQIQRTKTEPGGVQGS